MVSRRKILSRSRDDLNLDSSYQQQAEEDDVWYQKEKLFKEHIQEVLDKWNQIDDEIWAKIVVFEKNRRIAKAYARTPVLTINSAEDGFDGMRIGLCGFDNPMRDAKTVEIKQQVGQGVKLKMDSAGNILIRRYSRSNVYVKSTATATGIKEETSMSADILKLPNQALESEKVVKLFDMKKFQSNINRELRQAYPDRRRLELQCLSAIAFVKSENDVLDCPIWVLVINVVAMDMLKSKLPPMERPINVKSRPRLPIPDEDPYYIPGTVITRITDSSDSSGYGGGQSGNSGRGSNNNTESSVQTISTRDQYYQNGSSKTNEKPPQLPPRDTNGIYSHNLPTPDYDENEENKPKSFFRGFGSKDKARKKYVTEDPYYCGLSARTPNFTPKLDKTTLKKQSKNQIAVPKRMSVAYLQHPVSYITGYQYASQQQLMAPPRQNFQQMMWQARSMESGLDYPSQFNANLYGFDMMHDHRMVSRRPV